MKKVYLLPNFVTTLNMLCGFVSILYSIKGDFVLGAWLILVAAVFDALDGRIARLARATSDFGVEYDSLSDLISFGLAPALLIYTWNLETYGKIGWICSFIFLACGALRLARFNISTHHIPKKYFQGLPIPFAAGTACFFVLFSRETGFPDTSALPPICLIGMTTLGILMVSNIPFPSFKELNWRSRASTGYFLVGTAMLLLVVLRPEISIFAIGATFVVSSVVVRAIRILMGVPSPFKTSSHPK